MFSTTVYVYIHGPASIDVHYSCFSNSHLPFIVCRPRKTNVCFQFPFAANKRKFVVSVFRLHKTNGSCPFPLVPFSVCGIPETWRHGDNETRRQGDKEKWRHGDTERRRHGDTETQRCGDTETWRHVTNVNYQTENGSPSDFHQSIYRLLIVQTEVCRLPVC